MEKENDYSKKYFNIPIKDNKKKDIGLSVSYLICRITICLISVYVFMYLLLLIDDLAFQEKYYANITTKSDCSYVVPSPFEIITNGKTYAIKHKRKYLGDEYLNVDIFFGDTFFSDEITDPTLFVSECKAKGYLKKYLNHKQSMKDYK
jgi:hypothetical protein